MKDAYGREIQVERAKVRAREPDFGQVDASAPVDLYAAMNATPVGAGRTQSNTHVAEFGRVDAAAPLDLFAAMNAMPVGARVKPGPMESQDIDLMSLANQWPVEPVANIQSWQRDGNLNARDCPECTEKLDGVAATIPLDEYFARKRKGDSSFRAGAELREQLDSGVAVALAATQRYLKKGGSPPIKSAAGSGFAGNPSHNCLICRDQEVGNGN